MELEMTSQGSKRVSIPEHHHSFAGPKVGFGRAHKAQTLIHAYRVLHNLHGVQPNGLCSRLPSTPFALLHKSDSNALSAHLWEHREKTDLRVGGADGSTRIGISRWWGEQNAADERSLLLSDNSFEVSFPIKGSDKIVLIACPETWRHHSLILRIRSYGDISDDPPFFVRGIPKSEMLLHHPCSFLWSLDHQSLQAEQRALPVSILGMLSGKAHPSLHQQVVFAERSVALEQVESIQRTPSLLHPSAGLQISQIDDSKTQAANQSTHLALATRIIARKQDHAPNFPQSCTPPQILHKHQIHSLHPACSP